MGEAREFSQLLHEYYGAVIRRDVSDQEIIKGTILASAVVATGGLLFDSHLDLIKGAGLVGGTMFAAGNSVAWSERRKILDIGMQATACLYEAADNTGLTTTEVETSAQYYFRGQQSQTLLISGIDRLGSAVKLHRAALSASIAQAENEGKSTEVTEKKRLRDEIRFYLKAVETHANIELDSTSNEMAPYTGPMRSIERNARAMVNQTLDIQRQINLELLKLEPDIATFTNNIRGSLQQGMSAISGLPQGGLPVSEDETQPSSGAAQGDLPETAKDLNLDQPTSLEHALEKLNEALIKMSPEETAATREEIDALITTAKHMEATRSHLRRLTRIGFEKYLTVPENFMGSCTLTLPHRSLRFVPGSLALTLDKESKVYEFKVIGGLAPHKALPLDDSKIKIEKVQQRRQNTSIVYFKALASGETRIAITDSRDLSADMVVKVKTPKEPALDVSSCPDKCPCDVDESKQNRDGRSETDVKRLQGILLAEKKLMDGEGQIIADPIKVIDGTMGPVTRAGICRFQKEHNLNPIDGKITQAVWSTLTGKFKDGIANGAEHPYEFSTLIDKNTLKELKGNLVKVLAKPPGHFTQVELDAYEFDENTRQAIAEYRATLDSGFKEAKGWQRKNKAGELIPEMEVPLAQQLDKILHEKITKAAETL
ncbi:MAG: peptidoglycan-binding protein [Desulfobacterales bacterium]|nr:peptidoglycan-binding protein [Desulfobacterales bacterium]